MTTSLDAATRHRLAHALAGVDAATLRQDAQVAYEIADTIQHTGFQAPAMMRRLAALALAVSEMQRRGLACIEQDAGGDDFLCIDVLVGAPAPYGEIAIPAALAFLFDPPRDVAAAEAKRPWRPQGRTR